MRNCRQRSVGLRRLFFLSSVLYSNLHIHSRCQSAHRSLISLALLLILSHSQLMVQGRPLDQQPQNNLQHIAVVENAAWEQTLPQQFQNPFYKTPRVREALAKSSWFGPGEEVVYDRQAEKIPRMEIYNVLSHAGLIPRRRFFK